MADGISFFDMSVSTTPPSGNNEPLPVTVGPNRQTNDVRILFMTASGSNGNVPIEVEMTSNPPTGYTSAYSLNPDYETHGVFYRRLATGDEDTSVSWSKPNGWAHFMSALITARGVSPSGTPTGGNLKLSQTGGDTVVTTDSVTVPGAGVMLFFAGSVQSPGTSYVRWPVAIGVPDDWTHLVATDKSGENFYEYDTNPAIVVVGKSFSAAGSTGEVEFPTAQGGPAFAGLWCFLPAAQDVSMTIGSA